MARANDEKMLGANLPSEFVENFWVNAIPKGVKATKTEIVVAMANAWKELPDEVKKTYLAGTDLNTPAFEALVEQVIDRKLEAFYSKLSPNQLKTLKTDAEKTEKKLRK